MTEGQSSVGGDLFGMVLDLYPINRSITGDGVRQTLARIAQDIPLQLHEVPTGTPVLDWEVPREWNARAARIEDMHGRILVDFADNNLHLVSYSMPVDRVLSRDELARHVHTLPDQPALVPYRTAYYADSWGFCLSHALWESMRDESYRVVIDASLEPGSLTYGEWLIPGESADEVLISAHCCHPSLANDNLSGLAVATHLARRMASRKRRLSYRFLFTPATVGAITWLARNEDVVPRIRHGLILSCVGDRGGFHYKQSRQGDALVDRAVAHVLKLRSPSYSLLPFGPFGYDERQYCSPGYNLPVGCFMRSPNGTFPEYHTSADNLDLVSPEAMADSLDTLTAILELLDDNRLYERLDGRGEPQLGRRGLYRAISGQKEAGGVTQLALLWVLNLADGRHTLLDMAERAQMSFGEIKAAADLVAEAGLILEAAR